MPPVELAAAWADAYVRDAMELESTPLIAHAKLFGGPGTPAIDEFCVDELATLLEMSATSAQILIADALDLRWRLPRLWTQVVAGQVRAWQARKVAALTRGLSAGVCAELDEEWSGRLRTLPWGRFFRLVSAAVLDADPERAGEREARTRQARDVLATDSEDGLKLILARAVAGMRCGSWPPSTGWPTCSLWRVMRIRSGCAARRRSGSSPNPRER